MQQNCRKCKQPLPDGAAFCPQCGAKQAIGQRRAPTRSHGNGIGSVYKRGKTWTAAYVIGWKTEINNGIPRSIPIRIYKAGFRTKTEAFAYLPTLRNEPTKPRERSFAGYWALWSSAGMLQISKSKQTAYNIAHEKLGKWLHRSVATTSLADLQAIVNEKGESHYTARDIKSLLSHLYKLAILDEVVANNLALHITLPKLQEKEPIPFDEAEIKALWKDYESGAIFTGYLLLMIYSGMMPGELLIAEKSMIRWELNQIIGCGLKTKQRKSTPIAIADFIVPVLQSLCDISPTGKLLNMSKNDFYDAFRATIVRLGMRTELTAYSCRHATATALALGNIAPSVIQKAMRHAKFSTTERYIHPDTSDVRSALNTLHSSSPSPIPPS